jgi:hypothetical protein
MPELEPRPSVQHGAATDGRFKPGHDRPTQGRWRETTFRRVNRALQPRAT